MFFSSIYLLIYLLTYLFTYISVDSWELNFIYWVVFCCCLFFNAVLKLCLVWPVGAKYWGF